MHLFTAINVYLFSLLFVQIISKPDECKYDPKSKKYFSICETCTKTLEKSECPRLERNVEKLHDKIAILGKDPGSLTIRLENLKIDQSSNIAEKAENLQNLKNVEILSKIIESLTILSEQERNEELLVFKQENSFRAKFERFFSSDNFTGWLNNESIVTVVIILASICYNYEIMTIRRIFIIFLTVSYIVTYHQQIELARNKSIGYHGGDKNDHYHQATMKHKNFNSINTHHNINDEPTTNNHPSKTDFLLSYFFFWKTNTGYSQENYTSSKFSAKPLTVFIVMVTETFLEPFPIVAKALNEILKAAFDGLSIWLMPVMLIMILTVIFLGGFGGIIINFLLNAFTHRNTHTYFHHRLLPQLHHLNSHHHN